VPYSWGCMTNGKGWSTLAASGRVLPNQKPSKSTRYYWRFIPQNKLVCQVEYGEFTTEGKLRYPVYLRPRVDKDPEDCTLSDAPGWPGNQFIPV